MRFVHEAQQGFIIPVPRHDGQTTGNPARDPRGNRDLRQPRQPCDAGELERLEAHRLQPVGIDVARRSDGGDGGNAQHAPLRQKLRHALCESGALLSGALRLLRCDFRSDPEPLLDLRAKDRP